MIARNPCRPSRWSSVVFCHRGPSGVGSLSRGVNLPKTEIRVTCLKQESYAWERCVRGLDCTRNHDERPCFNFLTSHFRSRPILVQHIVMSDLKVSGFKVRLQAATDGDGRLRADQNYSLSVLYCDSPPSSSPDSKPRSGSTPTRRRRT